jgi:hypothetical protein
MSCRSDIQALSTRVRYIADRLYQLAQGQIEALPCDANDLELTFIGMDETVGVWQRKLDKCRDKRSKSKAVSRPGRGGPHDATTQREKTKGSFCRACQVLHRGPMTTCPRCGGGLMAAE